MPTYNRGYIVRDAIESALNQDYDSFELLVVDDGSTDDTHEIVETLHNDRIRYIRHDRNRGYSAGCNTGIAAARGYFVAFLDSDDIWKPNYLARQVSFLNRHCEVDVAFCDTEIQDQLTTTPSLVSLMRSFPKLLHPGSGTEYTFSGRQIYLCLLEEIPIKPTAAVIRRETIERAGGFDESWPSGTDWDVFLRLSRIARFGYINLALVIQRRTQDATHQKFREDDKLFLLSVFLKEKASLKGDPEALRAVNRGLVDHYNGVAWNCLEAKRKLDALSVYLSGFWETLDPMMLIKAAASVVPSRVRSNVRNAVKAAVHKLTVTNGSQG